MVRFQNLTLLLFFTFYIFNVTVLPLPLPFPSPHFHRNVRELFSNSAGSDVLQMETTTFSFGHPVPRIYHDAFSYFWGLLQTAFTYRHCPCLSRNFMTGYRTHCRPLQQTGYTESGTNSIIVWMCVVLPRVHTLKDYD
jgi:hypothetical protein